MELSPVCIQDGVNGERAAELHFTSTVDSFAAICEVIWWWWCGQGAKHILCHAFQPGLKICFWAFMPLFR